MARKRSGRSDGGRFIIGFHAIESQIQSAPGRIENLAVESGKSGKRLQKLLELAAGHGIAVVRSEKSQLDAMSHYGTHQGVIAVLTAGDAPARDLESTLEREGADSVVLVLDHLQDPHNLGACLRTAECAGVKVVILPNKGASPVNETVRKVASGAAEQLNIFSVANLGQAITRLKEHDYWVYGTSDQASESLYRCRFPGKVALVMGAEGDGMRSLTAKSCDHLLRIPMAGTVSSLNVSVATAVCLFEIRRQKAAD